MKPVIIGTSRFIKETIELIERVADTGFNVLIWGESGVGKEVVARGLHAKSPRRKAPFVPVNCAALPAGLLESELFGFERGAFTGAYKKKRGKFELANGGVLFLDEIGDMSFDLQSKLLTVLQQGEYSPLGGERDIKVDAWVVAATNHDLGTEIKDNKFREDLYYRLNIINIFVPPLRERPEDIEPLVRHFISIYRDRFSADAGMPPPQVMKTLTAYPWPGNVRELQNVLKSAVVLNNWEEVDFRLREEIPPQSMVTTDPASSRAVRAPVETIIDLSGEDAPGNALFSLKNVRQKASDYIEKELISTVLKHTGWNRSLAARVLDVSYKTLLSKIQALALEPPSVSSDEVVSYVLDQTGKDEALAARILEVGFKSLKGKKGEAAPPPLPGRASNRNLYGGSSKKFA